MARSRYDANETLEYIIGDDGEEYEYEREAPDPSMGLHPTYPPRLSSRWIDRRSHIGPLPDVRQSPISFDAGALESSLPSGDESATLGYAGTHPETGRRASQSSSRSDHQKREVSTCDDHSAAGSSSALHPTQTGTPGPHHDSAGESHNNYMYVSIEESFTYRESYHPTPVSVTDGCFTSAVESQSGSGGPLITTKNHVDYTKPKYDWESQALSSPTSTTGESAGRSSKALKKKKSLLSLLKEE
ncbi:hypothetical protein L202_03551 [Cryptococcus amylolentus CBS 6039]|uniref:Uncharacterized protein n=1 Tax=Cryptococcus amylolentus CBS 6039 TaxID=1295533 RepID=A0A1E3HTC6_9TREE|nr:hypothetical protein L202_03551 [Cryptococcus amylolentus CBS 6039]ODN79609.1 hypothetical protein L202_03551 [Cryptococcus amylolentus CBS 6039]